MVDLDEEQITGFHKTDASLHKCSKIRGGHVTINHPEIGLVDTQAAMLPTLAFRVGLHVHYGETVLRMLYRLLKVSDPSGARWVRATNVRLR